MVTAPEIEVEKTENELDGIALKTPKIEEKRAEDVKRHNLRWHQPPTTAEDGKRYNFRSHQSPTTAERKGKSLEIKLDGITSEGISLHQPGMAVQGQKDKQKGQHKLHKWWFEPELKISQLATVRRTFASYGQEKYQDMCEKLVNALEAPFAIHSPLSHHPHGKLAFKLRGTYSSDNHRLLRPYHAET